MRPARVFRGIIFDLNGVLWWDGRLQEEAWQRMSRQLRGQGLSRKELDEHIHGRNNRHTLTYLLGREPSRVELRRFTARKEANYRAACLARGTRFRLSPGATRLLDWLRTRGIPRTIASASEKPNMDFFTRHLRLRRWFDVNKLVYNDGTFPGKPDPAVYLLAAKALGIEPQHCVVVEDAVSGIQSAAAAGIGCIVALGPLPAHPTLLKLPGVGLAIRALSDRRLRSVF